MAAPSLVGAMPRGVRVLFQQVYRHFNRSLIQFEPACAQLRPGAHLPPQAGPVHRSTTSSSAPSCAINTAGLRDEEAALEAPDVIVLGDSYAMGWGVQQDETLARVLARTSGLKVLNAGVSSFGTVREMKLLDRLDTSRLKVLVVQYNDTDLVENAAFREHGGTLPILAAGQYQATVDWYRARQGYWPGKYIVRLAHEAHRPRAARPECGAHAGVDELAGGG